MAMADEDVEEGVGDIEDINSDPVEVSIWNARVESKPGKQGSGPTFRENPCNVGWIAKRYPQAE